MFDREPIEEIRHARQRWEAEAARAGAARGDEPRGCQHDPDLTVRAVYTPAEVADQDVDYLRDLGFPGHYPFTRGIYPSMYRGRLWTMRQYAGFGTARETNRRFRYMLERGMTGINVAFDLPTQHGYDSDDPRAQGEVGQRGRPGELAPRPRDPLRRHPAGGGQPGQRHQCAGRRDPGDVRGPGRAPGPRAGPALRQHPERHPQGVHRPRHLHLPAPALAPPGDGRDRVLRRAPAALELHQCLWLSHAGGGIDAGAGGGLRPGGRGHLRAGGRRAAG